jgi:hypothetical protein
MKVIQIDGPDKHLLYQIDDFLSKEECQEFIIKAHSTKIDDLGNLSWHRPNHTQASYSRVVMVDRDLADKLWLRVKDILPSRINGYDLKYLNSYFRFS